MIVQARHGSGRLGVRARRVRRTDAHRSIFSVLFSDWAGYCIGRDVLPLCLSWSRVSLENSPETRSTERTRRDREITLNRKTKSTKRAFTAVTADPCAVRGTGSHHASTSSYPQCRMCVLRRLRRAACSQSTIPHTYCVAARGQWRPGRSPLLAPNLRLWTRVTTPRARRSAAAHTRHVVTST